MRKDSILYKYRSWQDEFHKSCLINNEFYLTSSNDVNDPFDSNIPLDYSKLNSYKKIEKYIDLLIESAKPYMGDRFDLKDVKEKLINNYKSDPILFQNSYIKKEIDWNSKHFGLLSLSKRYDSILMWTHYANNHKGYCIGLNREKLSSSSLFSAGGEVKYSKKMPSINPLTDKSKLLSELLEITFIKTHTKAMDWNYEQEYRFLKLWHPNSATDNERKIYIPEDCFEEIIIGLNTNSEDKSEIASIAREKNISLYIIEQIPNTFLLKKTRI